MLMKNVSIVLRHPEGLAGKGSLNPAEKSDVHSLLDNVSSEFVPPLIDRFSSEGKNSVLDAHPIDPYFLETLDCSLLLAKTSYGVDESIVAGFISVKYNFIFPAFNDYVNVSSCKTFHYIKTVVVANEWRKQGIARMMYESLLKNSDDSPSEFLVRTWSTNVGHINLLSSLGFKEVVRVSNDRSVGVDTIGFSWQ